MKRQKGSLTVEAVISATVFISAMFILLTMVKLVLVMTVLNNATAETAKVVATSAYPISYLNVLQEGVEAKYESYRPQNLKETLEKEEQSNAVVDLLCGDEFLSSDIGSFLSDMMNGAMDTVELKAFQLKGDVVTWIFGSIAEGYVQNCGLHIDPEKLTIRAMKIPQTDTEYQFLHSEPLSLSESGSLIAQPVSEPDGTDGHFDAKDVLICMEYEYEMAMPFFPAFPVTLRSTAVERAWLHGTAVGPARQEGIRLDKLLFGDSEVVYIATGGYGECYHKPDCGTLWTSQICVTLDYAKEQGFKPCEVCKP